LYINLHNDIAIFYREKRPKNSSKPNGTDFWLVMRVHTGHHRDPMEYGLGLMVAKCAHQVDGWMDGQMDATRTILFWLSFQLS
jgi:hypothetical protein